MRWSMNGWIESRVKWRHDLAKLVLISQVGIVRCALIDSASRIHLVGVLASLGSVERRVR